MPQRVAMSTPDRTLGAARPSGQPQLRPSMAESRRPQVGPTVGWHARSTMPTWDWLLGSSCALSVRHGTVTVKGIRKTQAIRPRCRSDSPTTMAVLPGLLTVTSAARDGSSCSITLPSCTCTVASSGRSPARVPARYIKTEKATRTTTLTNQAIRTIVEGALLRGLSSPLRRWGFRPRTVVSCGGRPGALRQFGAELSSAGGACGGFYTGAGASTSRPPCRAAVRT